MSGQRGDTRTPAWVNKVGEFQRFSVPRAELQVTQSVHSAGKCLGVDNPSYLPSSFDPDFRLQTPIDQRGTPLTEFTHPYSRPLAYRSKYGEHQYDDIGDYPLEPEAGEERLDLRNRKGKYVRPLYIPDYSGDGSKPKSRRKRVIIFVVIGIFIVIAAAAVALTLTLLNKDSEAKLKNVVVGLAMPLKQDYDPEYANKSSDEYRSFSNSFCKNMTSVMTQYDDGFHGCTVTELKNGSVIVIFNIFFVTITATPTTDSMKEFFTKQSQENGADTDFLTLIKVDQIDVKDVSTDVKEKQFKPDYTVPAQTTTTKATSTVPSDTSTAGTASDTGTTAGTTSDTGTTAGMTSDTGTPAGMTSDTGTPAGMTSDTGTTAGTDSDTGTTAGMTSDTGTTAGTDSDTGTPTGTDSDTGTTAGMTSDTGTTAGTDSDTGTPAGMTSDTGTTAGTDSDTGTTAGMTSDTGTTAGTDSDTVTTAGNTTTT